MSFTPHDDDDDDSLDFDIAQVIVDNEIEPAGSPVDEPAESSAEASQLPLGKLVPAGDSVHLNMWSKCSWIGRRLAPNRPVVPSPNLIRIFERDLLEHPQSDSVLFGQQLLPVEYNKYDVFQRDMIYQALTKHCHIISPATTSVGKTYVARRIAAGLSLATTNRTALFISPNTEVLLENIEDIYRRFDKVYLHENAIAGTQSYGFTSWDETKPPPYQIVCITAGNIVPFLLNPINVGWIYRLSVVVFDEVHMDYVNRALWWMTRIGNLKCQYVLLSATLGNVADVVEQFRQLVTVGQVVYHCDRDRSVEESETAKTTKTPKPKKVKTPKKTKKPKPSRDDDDEDDDDSDDTPHDLFVSQLRVRPVPLQMMIWCAPPDYTLDINGSLLSLPQRTMRQLLDYNILRNVINWEDPTYSDTQRMIEWQRDRFSLSPLSIDHLFRASDQVMSPDVTRNLQYAEAQRVLEHVPTEQRAQHQKMLLDQPSLQSQVETAQGRPSSSQLAALIQYCMSNNMHPILIFDYSSHMAEQQAIQLGNYLAEVEKTDEKYQTGLKIKTAYDEINRRVNTLTEAFYDHKKEGSGPSKSKPAAKLERKQVAAADLALETFLKTHLGQELYTQYQEISNYSAEELRAMNWVNRWKMIPEAPDVTVVRQRQERTKRGAAKGNAMFEQRITPATWIKNLLDRGIGVYTDNMPHSIRSKILHNFRLGNIPVLFSGRELSVGLNLPVRTVITTGDLIDRSMFYQMAGRAGRRGFERDGFVIPLASPTRLQQYYNISEEPKVLRFKNSANQMDLITLYYNLPPAKLLVHEADLTPVREVMRRTLFNQTASPLRRYLYQLQIRSALYSGFLTHPFIHSFLDFDEPRALYWLELLRLGVLHAYSTSSRQLWIICYIWSSNTTDARYNLFSDMGMGNDLDLINQIKQIRLHHALVNLPEQPNSDVFRYLQGMLPVLLPQRLNELEEVEQAIQILSRIIFNLSPEDDQLRHVFKDLNKEIESVKAGSTQYVSISTSRLLNTDS